MAVIHSEHSGKTNWRFIMKNFLKTNAEECINK